jgi:hypothetical protein
MSSENEPLIPSTEHETVQHKSRTLRNRALVWSVLAVLLVVFAVVALVDPSFVSDIGLSEKLPRDPKLAAQRVLDTAPIIVRLLTHIFRSSLTDKIYRMGTLVCFLPNITCLLSYSALLRSSFPCSPGLAQ